MQQFLRLLHSLLRAIACAPLLRRRGVGEERGEREEYLRHSQPAIQPWSSAKFAARCCERKDIIPKQLYSRPILLDAPEPSLPSYPKAGAAQNQRKMKLW
ncbi:MAG: hypothetical protein IPM61_11660 [Chlorobi bacterium]|nr:hypothetical protein [Chlorobiota bacterium]